MDLNQKYPKEQILVDKLISKINFADAVSYCNRRLLVVLKDTFANELCVHPLGYCNRMCKELEFYPQLF